MHDRQANDTILSERRREVKPIAGGTPKCERTELRQAGRGLERNRLRYVVEAEIFVLDAIGVHLDDPQAGGVYAQRIPDGSRTRRC